MAQAEELDPDAMLREDATAQLIDVEIPTLRSWRCAGGGPPYSRLTPRTVRYRRGDVLAWIAARRVTSTAEYRELDRKLQGGIEVR